MDPSELLIADFFLGVLSKSDGYTDHSFQLGNCRRITEVGGIHGYCSKAMLRWSIGD